MALNKLGRKRRFADPEGSRASSALAANMQGAHLDCGLAAQHERARRAYQVGQCLGN